MLSKSATELAYDRTWLAYERTLQAWVRTATSLITFGFSVYKLSDFIERNPKRLAGPHEFGVALVLLGFFALVVSTLDYRQSIRELRKEYGRSPRSLSVWFACAVALLGVLALLSMLLNF